MEKKTVQLAELDLDLENPRTGRSRSQLEALQQLLLVEKFGDKVFALAADICQVGMLDPGERLYVMQSVTEASRFTALDGNRRVAALRLLSNPTLVENPTLPLSVAMRQRFKKLQAANAGRWPEELDVVVFESRGSAEHFIGVRHKGELAGAGRSEWSALQIARFDNSGLWQCLQELREAGELTQAVKVAIDSGDFPITTFDRVAGGKAFGSRFGCFIGEVEFRIGPTPVKARKALAQLADDVSSGKVTSRDDFAKAETMGSYIDGLARQVDEALEPKAADENASDRADEEQDDDPAQTEPRGGGSDHSKGESGNGEGRSDYTVKPDDSGGEDGGDAGTDEQKKPAPPRKKKESKYLLDKKELTYALYNSKCAEIVKELNSQVEVKRAPYACALLVRALQEMTADIYMHEVADYKGPHNAKNRITLAAQHLKGSPPKGAPADTIQLLNALDSANAYSELSEVAHNKAVSISDLHVRATWSSIKGGMSLLWEQIYLKTVL